MEYPRVLLSASANGWTDYENAVVQAGGRVGGGYCPTEDLSYDGLLLCGGDMNPALFGQKNAGSGEIDPARDTAELTLVEAFLSAGKPILGICRGHQVLNVALGGDLLQDLEATSRLFHWRSDGGSGDRVHALRTADGGFLFDWFLRACRGEG